MESFYAQLQTRTEKYNNKKLIAAERFIFRKACQNNILYDKASFSPPGK